MSTPLLFPEEPAILNLLIHRACGQPVTERPHMHVPDMTELYCPRCRWIVMRMHCEER